MTKETPARLSQERLREIRADAALDCDGKSEYAVLFDCLGKDRRDLLSEIDALSLAVKEERGKALEEAAVVVGRWRADLAKEVRALIPQEPDRT